MRSRHAHDGSVSVEMREQPREPVEGALVDGSGGAISSWVFRLVHYRKDACRIGSVGRVYWEVLHLFVEILELPVVDFPAVTACLRLWRADGAGAVAKAPKILARAVVILGRKKQPLRNGTTGRGSRHKAGNSACETFTGSHAPAIPLMTMRPTFPS